jgi:hypothetical protein
MGYAEGTTVSPAKSRMEIEELVMKRAGRDAEFSFGQAAGMAAIQFVANNRRVRFSLPMPTGEEAAKGAKRKNSWQPPSKEKIAEWLDAETRRRWRCLLLTIKAKFEVVETGIESFDEAFLANIVSAGGQTVYERILAATIDGQKLLAPVDDAKVVDIQAGRQQP